LRIFKFIYLNVAVLIIVLILEFPIMLMLRMIPSISNYLYNVLCSFLGGALTSFFIQPIFTSWYRKTEAVVVPSIDSYREPAAH
jgi:hypothetical protein